MRNRFLCWLIIMLLAWAGCGASGDDASCPDGTRVCADGCAPIELSCDDSATVLSKLIVSAGFFHPGFSPAIGIYSLELPGWVDELRITPVALRPDATILVNGQRVASGATSQPIPIMSLFSTIKIQVQVQGIPTRTYSLDVQHTTITYIKASNPDKSDFFGKILSLSGDTLAVGVPSESSNARGINGDQSNNGSPQSGAVYVFVRSGNSWIQQAYLKSSNADFDDYFGSSVSLDGDRLAVGAPGEDSSDTRVNGNQSDESSRESGAVYLFERNGSIWTQQAYLKASNNNAYDLFGASVAVSGDTVVVGAASEGSSATGVDGNQSDNGATGSGAAYVFVRNGTAWEQKAYLKASNTGKDDRFGSSLSISGNLLAIGAPNEDSGSVGINGNQADNGRGQTGAVYVFIRNGQIWSQQAYLKPSRFDSSGVYFGTSVAVGGETVAVGSLYVGAEVFVRTTGGFAWQAVLDDSKQDSLFGISVAVAGDLLAVGAANDASGALGLNGDESSGAAPSSGAAHVYVRNDNAWARLAYVKAINTDPFDRFGCAVALSGKTLVVGAEREASAASDVNGNAMDNSLAQSGAAYVYSF